MIKDIDELKDLDTEETINKKKNHTSSFKLTLDKTSSHGSSGNKENRFGNPLGVGLHLGVINNLSKNDIMQNVNELTLNKKPFSSSSNKSKENQVTTNISNQIPNLYNTFSYKLLISNIKSRIKDILQTINKPVNFWINLKRLNSYIKEYLVCLKDIRKYDEKIKAEELVKDENIINDIIKSDNNILERQDKSIKDMNTIESEIFILNSALLNTLLELIYFAYKKIANLDTIKELLNISIDMSNVIETEINFNYKRKNKTVTQKKIDKKEKGSNLKNFKSNNDIIFSKDSLNETNVSYKDNINLRLFKNSLFFQIKKINELFFNNVYYREFYKLIDQINEKICNINVNLLNFEYEKDHNRKIFSNLKNKILLNSDVLSFFNDTIFKSVLYSVVDPKKQYYIFSQKNNNFMEIIPKAPFLKPKITNFEVELNMLKMNSNDSSSSGTKSSKYIEIYSSKRNSILNTSGTLEDISKKDSLNTQISKEEKLLKLNSSNEIKLVNLNSNNSQSNSNNISYFSSPYNNFKTNLVKNNLNLMEKSKNVHFMTLVLDMDECLIHSVRGENGIMFLTRPYVKEFLEEMHKMYEIGIFTSSTQDYAEPIIDYLCKKDISFSLYRQHCADKEGKLKDLSKIGRDLKSLVFIDNCEENYSLQKDNSFLINTWEFNIFDEQLLGLANLLKYMNFMLSKALTTNYENISHNDEILLFFNENKEPDIRTFIRHVKTKVTNEKIFKSKNPYDSFTI